MKKSVRMQVSFDLPEGMTKREAVDFVRAAISHAIAANPSREIDAVSLRVVRFVVS